ncbi:MAG: biotin transport system substrate-specific component [Saprospiraceae bacterium]|jgi:biotin transport system substrate-specific component
MKINRIIIILLGILIISISAQWTIEIGNIPITGQTLSILILAFFFKPTEMFITSFTYVFLGVLGLPIFADGESGLEKLIGGSGGFLVGFIISSTIISYLFQFSKSVGWLTISSLTSLGTIIIILFGVGRLTTIYGIEKGIEYGFAPFWLGALVKILIGTIITYYTREYVNHLSKK